VPFGAVGGSGAGSGSAFNMRYLNRAEDVVPVMRRDLREIGEFGVLEEGAGAVGMFFVSGAFWLLATIVIEHYDNMKTIHWAGIAFCVVCMVFGGVLLWVARRHFRLRDDRIRDLFNEPRWLKTDVTYRERN